MEGQGPANGTPANLGFIAASQNPFALDIAVCQILGIAPQQVPYLSTADGLEKHAPQVAGDEIKVNSFEVPAGAHLMSRVPTWLINAAMGLVWVRPAFSKEKCVKCALCVKACPVEALTLNKDLKAPLLDTKICITCSCCHEVCPEDAIRMRQSPLLRLVGAFKDLE
jgi:Pyruvate/2-oxoacid:ferredoxin oxidoreductase delta subunit